MSTKVRYHKEAERPSLSLWILDDDGSLIDFSSGYSFELKIGIGGQAALLTKTSGITGATGSGSEPDGTPNVTVAWSSGELNLTPGTYALQLKATTGGADRLFELLIVILDVVT